MDENKKGKKRKDRILPIFSKTKKWASSKLKIANHKKIHILENKCKSCYIRIEHKIYIVKNFRPKGCPQKKSATKWALEIFLLFFLMGRIFPISLLRWVIYDLRYKIYNAVWHLDVLLWTTYIVFRIQYFDRSVQIPAEALLTQAL